MWKCPETPPSVNKATNIQTTVIDNQQQFVYIHSTGVTAFSTLSSPFNRKSSSHLTDSPATCWTGQSLFIHMVGYFWLDLFFFWMYIALHLPLIRAPHTLVMLLIICPCWVLLNKSLVKGYSPSPRLCHSHQLSCDSEEWRHVCPWSSTACSFILWLTMIFVSHWSWETVIKKQDYLTLNVERFLLKYIKH